MARRVHPTKRRGLLATIAAAAAAIAPGDPRGRRRGVDPATCTASVEYDPAIPTFAQYRPKKGSPTPPWAASRPAPPNRHLSAELYGYEEAIAAAAVSSSRVHVLVKSMGQTVEGRPFQYSVVGNPREHIARLRSRRRLLARRAGRDDLRKLRPRHPCAPMTRRPPSAGSPRPRTARARRRRGLDCGCSTKLAARTDCANARRLQDDGLLHRPGPQPPTAATTTPAPRPGPSTPTAI